MKTQKIRKGNQIFVLSLQKIMCGHETEKRGEQPGSKTVTAYRKAVPLSNAQMMSLLQLITEI